MEAKKELAAEKWLHHLCRRRRLLLLTLLSKRFTPIAKEEDNFDDDNKFKGREWAGGEPRSGPVGVQWVRRTRPGMQASAWGSGGPRLQSQTLTELLKSCAGRL